VLSGRGLCDELITRPEESYRLWCVVVCDLETSRIDASYVYDISSLRVNIAPSDPRVKTLVHPWATRQVRIPAFGKWRKHLLTNLTYRPIRCYIQGNKCTEVYENILYTPNTFYMFKPFMCPSSGGALQRIDISIYYTLTWMVMCYIHAISLHLE